MNAGMTATPQMTTPTTVAGMTSSAAKASSAATRARDEGESVGRGRVERLMARNAIVGAKRRGKPWRTTIAGDQPVSAPDLLQRAFTARRPNERWCADFSYLRCWTGVVFLSSS